MQNITVVGDSITEGNHLSTYGENWPYKLLERLDTPTNTDHFSVANQSSPATTTNKYWGSSFTIWNAGVGGNTTTMCQARYATDVLGHSSDIDVILIGVNDISLGYDQETVTKANIISMVNASSGAGRRIILCTLTPWPGGSTAQRNSLNSLNSWISSWGPTNGCTVVDLYSANPAMQGDQVHPSAAGCTTMANAFDLDSFQPTQTPTLTATAEASSIHLVWTDTITGEDGWYVERRVVS